MPEHRVGGGKITNHVSPGRHDFLNRSPGLSEQALRLLSAGLLTTAPVIVPLMGVIVVNGLVIGRLEGWQRSDAIYHAFINATTAGYGYFRPTKGWAKVLSVFNAFLGLLLTGIFVGTGVYAVETVLKLPAS